MTNAGTSHLDDKSVPPRVLGLVAGLGPPMTEAAYRALADVLGRQARAGRLVSMHADYGRAIGYARSSDRAGLARYLCSLVEPMAAAGARHVAIAAVTPHLCILELQALSPIPVIDLVEVLRMRLQERSIHRLALLSTSLVMSSRLFGRLADFDLVELDASETDAVNRIHADLVNAGRAGTADSGWLRRLGRELGGARGAQAVVVVGTELASLLDGAGDPVPVIDGVRLHHDAIVRLVTG